MTWFAKGASLERGCRRGGERRINEAKLGHIDLKVELERALIQQAGSDTMLTPEEFVARWETEVVADIPEMIRDDCGLITCDRASPSLVYLSESSADFIVQAGLPWSCAPFLGFREVGKGMPRIAEVWNFQEGCGLDLEDLSKYLTLGSDGAGNPICLDISDEGRIYMVDHDDSFRSRVFVSSDIPSLAEALLLANSLDYPDFMCELRKFDPEAAAEKAFLPTEVRLLQD